jgi:hypothetical protein
MPFLKYSAKFDLKGKEQETQKMVKKLTFSD